MKKGPSLDTKELNTFFGTKELAKPGGHGYRTVASYPPSFIKCAIERANRDGFGHRLEHGKLVISRPDAEYF
jgi:hypothetical protein